MDTFNAIRSNFLEVLPEKTLIIDATKSIEEVHKTIVNYVSSICEK